MAELTEQLTQRFGDQGRVRQRREVVTRPFGHGPAEFPRRYRLVLVGLAQLEVSGGGIGPGRGRVNFLEHGQWQPGAAGGEIRRAAGSGISSAMVSSPHHCGQGGSQPWSSAISRSWAASSEGAVSIQLRPGGPQASVDEDVTPDLTEDGARCGQQLSRPAVTDEYRGLAGRAAGYHLGLP